MNKPEKKKVDGACIGIETLASQDIELEAYNQGYNQACDEWEKYVKELEMRIASLKCTMDSIRYTEMYDLGRLRLEIQKLKNELQLEKKKNQS